jgi:hypothetical protein
MRRGARPRRPGRQAGFGLMAIAAAIAGAGWFGATQTAVGYGRFNSASAGYDISWPQCGLAYPGEHRIGVVGVNGGRPFTHNRCLGDEYNWALTRPHKAYQLSTPALYMNLAYGERRNGARSCEKWDLSCQAYNYGSAAASDALSFARGSGGDSDVWWIDVETGNSWSDRVDLNATVIQAAIDRLKAGGVLVGIYSTHRQWGIITGSDYNPKLPAWVAGANNAAEAPAYCRPDHAFGGGTVWLVQFPVGEFDGDYAC